ncbi:DUF1772 domain-containing protein [Cytophagaceae bacterium YF14B1]|uniref:DUF1772 domain-containing protein n=1 Tax=Xanthocytophaga flava TaxID=3048013 RepID=A0AAE3U623_9BACT|nr:anthrone oxygenase family protein [Xanthocytophaga flavus]MDJ1480901.1 DUF1772 domain-containing protein [Xanthocytophaga flavus]
MESQLIQFITLLLLLLVTGVFFGPWLALHRSLHLFSKEEFIKITKILGANLGRPMQIMMPLCIVFMLLSVISFPQKSSVGFYVMVASLICILITLIVTLTTELPIVNKIREYTIETLPANWEAIRDKWVRFHALRVFPAILSFALFITVILHIV